jgi:hypothetical protein
MTTLSATLPSVQPIPTDSDGLLIPRLIPVAAYLCCEEYDDTARSRVLERLADGVIPRACVGPGLLEWSDLAEVERLTARRPAAVPPIRGGAPSDPDPELTVWLAEPVRTAGVPLPLDAALPYRPDWTSAEIDALDRLMCPYPDAD